MEQEAKRNETEQLTNKFLISVAVSPLFVAIIFFSVILFAIGFPVEASQAGRMPRIVYVGAGSGSTTRSVRLDSLREGLRELGWVDGKNFALERRSTEAKLDRADALADEMVRLKVDVVVWSGGVQAAKRIKTVPVVVVTGDPVSTGLVDSLPRPGGNITGLTYVAPELGGKRLELLKETFPKLSRVAVLYNPDNPANLVELEKLRGAAAALQVTLRPIEARGPDQIAPAFSTIVREKSEGLSTASGAVNNTNRSRILELAVKNKLPAIYHEGQFVDEGGLMAYGPNLAGMFRRAAYFVDRILKGAKPADLPVEQPTKFEFVINLKTAKALNLTIPQSVLYRADRVIK